MSNRRTPASDRLSSLSCQRTMNPVATRHSQVPGLAETNAHVLLCRGADSAAAAVHWGAKHASSEWIIFCHQDVFFPKRSGQATASFLSEIPESERSRAILGFAGLAANRHADQLALTKAGLVVKRVNARVGVGSQTNRITVDGKDFHLSIGKLGPPHSCRRSAVPEADAMLPDLPNPTQRTFVPKNLGAVNQDALKNLLPGPEYRPHSPCPGPWPWIDTGIDLRLSAVRPPPSCVRGS